MKPNIIRLSQRYATALRAHLQPGLPASLKPLELARFHKQAITTLKLSQSKDGLVRRAKMFFTEALTPIMATHDAAQQSQKDLQQLNAMLNRRTLELAATNRRLQCGIRQCKRVETTPQKTGKRSARLLKDSLQLQKGRRQLRHRIGAGQRRTITAQLPPGKAPVEGTLMESVETRL
jgi:uncharacterized protein (DUF3084 family)